jgi:hypothetical protein
MLFTIIPFLVVDVNAFGRMDPEFVNSLRAKVEARGLEMPTRTRQVSAQGVSATESNCGPLPCAIFDASEQFVSTTGDNAYASPLASQIRGPCPGLNAAANHGYLDRSGVVTLEDTITGLGQAYGMSPDLAAGLAAYAIAMDGDVLTQTWSIGGPQPANTLSGLLGTPQGISYSHSKYEGDSSIGRNDAYLANGDAHSLNITRFMEVYALGLDDDRYTLDKFRQQVEANQQVSISNNPYYFAPLFSTTLVVPAAYNFVINFMSNHSAEEPSGYLDGSMFKQFFAVGGDYPNFTWLPGQERIPDNWYRRTSTNQYNIPNVFEDLAIGWLVYPNSFRLGGNVNGVNTYAGVNLTDLTAGTYNFNTLFEGDNFECFFFQTQEQAVPDTLKAGINDVADALSLIDKYFGSNVLSGLSCPQLAGYDNSVFQQYPGRTYSPTGPATNY